MIYLNNAGTTWPKAPGVTAAVASFFSREPLEWGDLFAEAQAEVSGFFGVPPERFWLTPGCTSALALAFASLPWQPGDVLLTSSHEHQALARWPAYLAQTQGVVHRVAPMDPEGLFDLHGAEAILRQGGVKLVACSMASNVTGALLPAPALVDLAHRYGALCLLDGAQAAGILPLDLAGLGADIFAFAGHKGTLGPQGIGGLYVAPGTPWSGLEPRASAPSYCDLGSVDRAALAGLVEGIRWIQATGPQVLRDGLVARCQRLLDGLHAIEEATVYGPSSAHLRSSAISLRLEGYPVAALDRRLREEYGILGSAGHHCAPMAHKALGTHGEGTLRLSPGAFTTDPQIDAALEALASLASS